MSDFIKIQELESGYKNFKLKNININIKKGSFNALIGPNGSGKTTLFKTITGEIPIKNGNIIIDNNNLSEINKKKLAQKISIVTQNTDASDISVEDYVMMGRIPYRHNFQLFEKKQDYNIAYKFMKLTGVLKFKKRMLYQLSGGEQQLVAITKALTQEPDLLLLDEPTSHLDISHQIQILNLIQELNENLKLTVLLIIHDLNLAAEYCNNLILMNDGNVFTQGSPNKVLHYKNIEKVYKTVVVTHKNPLSKKPVVLLVSAKTLNSNI